MASDLDDGHRETGDGADSTGDASEEDVSYRRFTRFRIGRHELCVPVSAVATVADPVSETTRIPRTPDAISGITDIRGQMTVILDPHVHFPDSGGPADEQSLLVFDRPEQPAAIHVDEVYGVEVVPEDDVVSADEYEPDEIEGSALAHPLVSGAVAVERVERDPAVESTGSRTRSGAMGFGTDRHLSYRSARTDSDASDEDGVTVQEFSLDEEESTTDAAPTVTETVTVDVYPLLDVERFFLASGGVVD